MVKSHLNRRYFPGFFFLFIGISVLFFTAQSGFSETQPTPSRLALVGGTLIDGYGGKPLPNSVILIEGEYIKAIGQVGAIEIPGDARIISTEGMSVLPGLWDAHVHLMINGHTDYAHWDKTYPPLFRDNPEILDDPSCYEGLPENIVKDIRNSFKHPERLPYYQITPQRIPTLARKFQQLRNAGLVLLVGTDSGIPMLFHSQSTWNEIDIWVNKLNVDPMEAIRAATYWPAVQMKVENKVGTISEGKYADIIAVRGDILRHICLLQRVDIVIKHGRRYK
ncbi:MAG: amidohydrolase family protein [Candidatus Aminicenantes bacterium]|nr:amidohydrolase family protein [Candidatus Aminicenantes bacterium]NIM82582.1 amidohydrolase family protein [Candidatus Aminicenantes bacterium]NIN21940.1 amidohydrolase family protein [Candidatus Aminicenantes bacterium]NIN45721.1 amidohydrolase family protein [Candidatus Aminicenantes bacterium]NIN88553.1 amidohydrolase family protein [Candidatus Aminicenantes bacterium]